MPRANLSGPIALLLLSIPLAATAQPNKPAPDLEGMRRDLVVRLSGGAGNPSPLVLKALDRDHSVLSKGDLTVVGTWRETHKSQLAWSWYLLRIGPQAVPLSADLTEAELVRKAMNLGKIVVTSEPNGAVIFVDGVQWPQNTNQEGFAEAGYRRIRVQKPGLQPVEKNCAVQRDGITTFVAKLLTSGSQATC